ncbi:HK97 family phage prohead protease [Halocynthiibacter namhaensis]|uniref:HK97 family phage prohead protease n=1 Tax=Halocynthiibacter namhaensis TaxID=1290553 RepID=UPI0005794450|nr:HK97 family phage prohead protease [Halocynthiibacter namhaensis]
MTYEIKSDLEVKFCRMDAGVSLVDGASVEGYASYFGIADQGGDVVEAGAYEVSLAALAQKGRNVKMLWQHDPAQPIGIWDEIREDSKGLYVKGRLLLDVEKGREAAALIEAGAIDGLSIGYRTKKATKNNRGQRLLNELELWEVSLVTFPMLPEARIGAKGDTPEGHDLRELAGAIEAARQSLTRDEREV